MAPEAEDAAPVTVKVPVATEKKPAKAPAKTPAKKPAAAKAKKAKVTADADA